MVIFYSLLMTLYKRGCFIYLKKPKSMKSKPANNFDEYLKQVKKINQKIK